MGVFREGVPLTLSATDTTVGKVTLVVVNAVGSAAASTLTILDGTAVKLKYVIPITAGVNYYLGGVGFNNLVTDMTGTASYSLVYAPRP